MQKAGKRLLLFAFFCVSCTVLATTLVQMNLQQMTGNADKVFRGRVVAIDSGKVAAGGAQLPTVTYKLIVEEAFKGEFTSVNKQKVAIVTMISSKEPAKNGRYQRFSPFRDLPKLQMGQTYLLFTTQPSKIGLSTTVGLGQGSFQISGKPGLETAVNEFNNAGLFRGIEALAPGQRQSTARAAGVPAPLATTSQGPIAYSDLAAKIRSFVGGK